MTALQVIALADLRPSPTNPRRLRDKAKDAELAESIAKVGVLQPVLVRPVNGYLELVVGRRRFDAAIAAGLAEIPAVVRELDDLEALELQITENAQREDVHPLEEAEAFETLHEKHGRSVDEIAAKVGKSRAHVYARMKLCALGAPGRKAFYDGRLTPSTALLVARIPEVLQKDALEQICGNPRWGDGEPLPFRQAAGIIHERFMLRLHDAPFSKADAELVPEAGPCTTCSKRTGNQRELFADVKGADVCTDPPCYRGKLDAWWTRRSAEAKESGQRVLEGAAAKKLFRYDRLDYNAPYVELSQRCYEDPKNRTYQALLGKHAPTPVLVRTEDGLVHEIVEKKAIAGALAAARHKKLIERPRERQDSRGRDTAQRTKDEVRVAAGNAALERLVELAPKLATRGLPWWRFLAISLLAEVWHESRKAAAVRRELKPGKQSKYSTALDWEGALKGWIAKASEDALAGLVVELLVQRDVGGSWRTDFGDTLKAACALAKIDLAKLKTAATAEVKARARKRAERKKGAGGKRRARAPKVRACRECGCTDDEACDGGCEWVAEDLCSACEEAA